VIATIKNYGTTTLTSIPVAYTVNNATPVTATWTGSLAPGATANYTFATTYTGPDTTSYSLCAYTTLTGDIHPTNDAICKNLQTDVGIIEQTSGGLVLYQNYPNPAKDYTNIGYSVPVSGDVTLHILNAIGKVVYSETRNAIAGHNKIILNTTGFTAGIYFYEFEYNGSKSYKKMIIF
jgi:hypothetical protein